MHCDDYPCCGHGPAPFGDDGGCPDAAGRFTCVECGDRMPTGHTSAICEDCLRTLGTMDLEEREYADCEECLTEDV